MSEPLTVAQVVGRLLAFPQDRLVYVEDVDTGWSMAVLDVLDKADGYDDPGPVLKIEHYSDHFVRIQDMQ